MKTLLFGALALIGSTAALAQSPIYSTSDFSGWYVGRATVAGGDLVTTASTTQSAWTHFETAGNPYNVSTGETLTLSLNFSLDSGASVNSSQNFYITLQNSNNNQVAQNITGTSNAAFANYTGYALMANPYANSASAGRFNYRSGTNTNIVGSTAAWSQIYAMPTATVAQLVTGKNYNLTWTVEQVSSAAYDFTYTLTNVTDSLEMYNIAYSATALSGASFVDSFDTIALGMVSTQSAVYRFTDLSLTSSIPEPSTYALGAGILALGLVAGLRGRRKKTAI